MVSPEESSPGSISLNICSLGVTFSRVLSWEHKHPTNGADLCIVVMKILSAGEDVGTGEAPGKSCLCTGSPRLVWSLEMMGWIVNEKTPS